VLDEAKKVDRMLALLSSPNPDENELTHLYNDIIPLRPQLGKIIDKYGVRKEELFALNNQLNQEVKQYNDLMDSTIASRTNNYQNATPYPTGQFAVPPAPGPFGAAPNANIQEHPQNQHMPNMPNMPNQQTNPLPHAPEMTTGPQQSSYVNYNQARPENPQFYLQSSFAPPQDPPRQYASDPPATTFQQYPGQQQQYLQQQPTSTGFGNSPDQPQFLNVNHFPEIRHG